MCIEDASIKHCWDTHSSALFAFIDLVSFQMILQIANRMYVPNANGF